MARPFSLAVSPPPSVRVRGSAGEVMAGILRDQELDLLHNAELKEAFDEFDKVLIIL